MIRKLDNPAPQHDGPIRIYFGPARNRPLERIFQLSLYASIRHAHSLSLFWFDLMVGCFNAMAFMDDHWVRKITGPEFQKQVEAMRRFHKNYPPLPQKEWPKEE